MIADAGVSGDRAALAAGAELVRDVALSISRYVGPHGPSGGGKPTLSDYAEIGTLGSSALLSLRVFGLRSVRVKVLVDAGAGFAPARLHDPSAPSRAGAEAVLAPSEACAWETVAVRIPIESVPLPFDVRSRRELRVRLVVDEAEPGATGTFAVGRVELAFAAQAPVVLVHGIDDYPEQAWKEIAPRLGRGGFVADTNVDFAGLSDKPGIAGARPSFNGSVKDDVVRIEQRLRRLEDDYGTKDVHLVAHSKGGLDLVNFLALRYPALEAEGVLRVLSLQTLAAPHRGSVNADLVAPLRAWAKQQGYTSQASLGIWGLVADATTDKGVIDTTTLLALQAVVLDGSGPLEPGLSDLLTTSEAVRVDQTWSGDPRIAFATYAWDADFERSKWYNELGQSASPPEPGDLFSKYSTDCRGIPAGSSAWSRYCIDEDEGDTFFAGTPCAGLGICGASLWRQMAHGKSATVTHQKETVGSRSTARVEPWGEGVWMPNDLTVAVASATHPKATKSFVFAGPEPRSIPDQRRFGEAGGVETFTARCARTGGNHASILKTGRSGMVECTVADVVAWIRERTPLP